MIDSVEKLIYNPKNYIENLLWLRDKEANVRPFKLNAAQRKVRRIKNQAARQGRPARFLILKSRRCGVTTLEQALNFHTVATRPNTQVVTLAQESESTEKIFRIAQLFHDRLPEDFRPEKLTEHNKRELNFHRMNSLFYIGTAGKRGFGRGDTLNRVHCSEVAWWRPAKSDQEKLLAGLTEACSHGEVSLETTPNGVGDMFHDLWQESREGSGSWTPIFLAWWDDPDNSIPIKKQGERQEILLNLDLHERKLLALHKLKAEQFKWRRTKKQELKGLFEQEYPEDDVTCFLVSGVHFFDLTIVRQFAGDCASPLQIRDNGALQIWKEPEPGRRYAAGVDVSEGTAHGDFGGVGILDLETCEQVASFHARVRPEVLGKKAVELCQEYNDALLAIEANNHGHSALNTCRNQMRYWNLYHHENYDATGTRKLGWQTNDKTRCLLLDDLKVAVEDRLMKINDKRFISEIYTFEDNGTGKYEARPGSHDDCVIKWGIAWQARKAPWRAPRVTVL